MPKRENMTPSQLANIEGHKFKKGQSGNPAGSKPNRIARLLKEILPKSKRKIIAHDLTNVEINTIERKVLQLELPDLQAICKCEQTPAYMKSLAMAVIIDMKNGKTTTVDTLRSRQYGATKQQVEVTGKDGQPLIDRKTMTQEEARQLLKKVEDEC
jgi:hypothetical protein